MATSSGDRIIPTVSSFCKENFLYVQEVGTLTSLEPHISSRKGLTSYLFFVVLEGSGTFMYDSNSYHLDAGDCIYIDCKVPYSHESSADNPWKLMWVHFHGKQAPIFYSEYQKHHFSPVFQQEDVTPIIELLSSIYKQLERPNPLTELNCNQYLTSLITMCFQRNHSTLQDDSSIQNKLNHIREYIAIHYTEKLSLDSLANDFYISKFHLAREYHKAFGITLGNDITWRRISKAKSLLRFTNASIETISLVCGFSDAGYFIKVFRKEEKMTPLEYRKKW